MIAYLAEPSEVTDSGEIHGKTIRCYEVDVEITPENSGSSTYYRNKHTPTGWAYVLKNGKAVKQRTKATLNNKYVSGYSQRGKVKTSINEHTRYNSCYYETPELALLAKLNNIRLDYSSQKQQLQTALAKLSSCEPYIKSFYELANDFPELLI